jgi:hypothetical protein
MGFKLRKGSDIVATFYVMDDDGIPVSLAGVTEITVKFPQADSTDPLVKKLSLAEVAIISATLGQFTVDLSDTDTALLRAGERQTVEALIDYGTTRKVCEFTQEWSVYDRIFS